MLRLLRVISATAAGAERRNIACQISVRVRYGRSRKLFSATAVVGSNGKTDTQSQVGAIALSRGIRHGVAAVHVGSRRPVSADTLSGATPGERQQAKIVRLGGLL